jgi:hypothetical protein
MSIEKINLRKLLQLFFADERLQRSLLLADIRGDAAKASGDRGSGGDFYGPFWADVKDHAAGRSDLADQTGDRIRANKTRARLYPLLTEGFLEMWREKMRWRNEPFEFVAESVKAQLPIKKLGTIVKIENTASVKVWDGSHRIIYPYFSEEPALPEEGARLGFWALQTALPDFRQEDFRIVDLLRRTYFRPTEVGAKGDEEKQFVQRYEALLKKWRKLREERR